MLNNNHIFNEVSITVHCIQPPQDPTERWLHSHIFTGGLMKRNMSLVWRKTQKNNCLKADFVVDEAHLVISSLLSLPHSGQCVHLPPTQKQWIGEWREYGCFFSLWRYCMDSVLWSLIRTRVVEIGFMTHLITDSLMEGRESLFKKTKKQAEVVWNKDRAAVILSGWLLKHGGISRPILTVMFGDLNLHFTFSPRSPISPCWERKQHIKHRKSQEELGNYCIHQGSDYIWG